MVDILDVKRVYLFGTNKTPTQSRCLFITFSLLHVSHARGRSQRGERCRQNRYDDLNDGLPSFLFHAY